LPGDLSRPTGPGRRVAAIMCGVAANKIDFERKHPS
jgi:hypothetical protein